MTRWKFHAPLWAWFLAPAACTAMLGLASWQLQRGDAKRDLQQRYLSAETAAPRTLDARSRAEPGSVSKARARGRYLDGQQLLLDNQSHAQQPGYHVWTPLLLDAGGLVLVDRGWIGLAAVREARPLAPLPPEAVEVEGLWRSLPAPGLRVEVDNCRDAPWPRVVHYPTAEDLRCIYGPAVASGVLLLAPQAPAGFVRDWQITPEMPPEKHYAYAVQWLGLALLGAVLFIKLNLKRVA